MGDIAKLELQKSCFTTISAKSKLYIFENVYFYLFLLLLFCRLWHTTNIYLHPTIHEYAQKLVATMPGDLKVRKSLL